MHLARLRRAASRLALAASLPLLLADCEPGEPAPCDFTMVPFELPEPGDILTLHTTFCIDSPEASAMTLWVENSDYGTYTGLGFSVLGDHLDMMADDYLELEVRYTASFCDDGLTITLENTRTSGPYIGVLRMRSDAGDSWERCDVNVESP